MTTPNDGGPAFPHQPYSSSARDWSDGSVGMSLRAYAAIHLGVPESGIDWLDVMIAKANRDKLAGQALAGLCANPSASNQEGWGCEVIARAAYEAADAMLAEMEKTQ